MVFLSLAAPFLFLLKDEKEFLIAKKQHSYIIANRVLTYINLKPIL